LPEKASNGIDQIRKLIQAGKFDEVFRLINTLFKKSTSPLERFQCQLLSAEAHSRAGKYEKVVKQANDLITISKKLGDPLHEIDALIAVIESFWRLGNVEKATTIIENGKKLLSALDNPSFCREASLIHHEGAILWLKGESRKALDLLTRSLEIRRENCDDYSIAVSLNSIGLVHWQEGRLDLALDRLLESLELRRRIGNNHDIAVSFNNLGLIYWNQGDLNKALEYYTSSLTLFKRTDSNVSIATVLNNIGLINQDKGELDAALDAIKESLDIRERIGNEQDIAISTHNLARVLMLKGDILNSLGLFKKCLTIEERIGNNYYLTDSLLHLIELYIEENDLDQANLMLLRLEEISTGDKNAVINQRYRLAQAMIYKTGKRAKKRAKAEEMLEEIVNEEIVEHGLTINAMLHLCDLYLYELKATGESELLLLIKELIDKLMKTAKKQSSNLLLIESYILKSRLMLAEMDLKKEQELLVQAQMIAEEKGLNKLVIRVSNEHDALLEQYSRWEQETNGTTDIERLEQVNIEQSLEMMSYKKKIEPMVITEDIPVMITIVTKTGMSLYSKTLDPSLVIKEQIMAGLFTAMNSFSAEIFSRAIDRIKIAEFTLLFKSEGALLVVYAFKGHSYAARRKLDNFIQQLRENEPLWSSISQNASSSPQIIRSSTKKEIDEIITANFSFLKMQT